MPTTPETSRPRRYIPIDEFFNARQQRRERSANARREEAYDHLLRDTRLTPDDIDLILSE